MQVWAPHLRPWPFKRDFLSSKGVFIYRVITLDIYGPSIKGPIHIFHELTMLGPPHFLITS